MRHDNYVAFMGGCSKELLRVVKRWILERAPVTGPMWVRGQPGAPTIPGGDQYYDPQLASDAAPDVWVGTEGRVPMHLSFPPKLHHTPLTLS